MKMTTPYAPETRGWDRRSTGLLLCVLVIAIMAIVRGIRVGEFSYNVDETQHAVTGLYVADLVRDHPFAHLVEYTYCYYARNHPLAAIFLLLRRRATHEVVAQHCCYSQRARNEVHRTLGDCEAC